MHSYLLSFLLQTLELIVALLQSDVQFIRRASSPVDQNDNFVNKCAPSLLCSGARMCHETREQLHKHKPWRPKSRKERWEGVVEVRRKHVHEHLMIRAKQGRRRWQRSTSRRVAQVQVERVRDASCRREEVNGLSGARGDRRWRRALRKRRRGQTSNAWRKLERAGAHSSSRQGRRRKHADVLWWDSIFNHVRPENIHYKVTHTQAVCQTKRQFEERRTPLGLGRYGCGTVLICSTFAYHQNLLNTNLERTVESLVQTCGSGVVMFACGFAA